MRVNEPDSLALTEELEPWISELRDRGLRTETELGQLRAVLAESRGEGLDRPIEPILVVMLCGPTGVGKSTLINTLAGREISLPGLGATTDAAVVYAHENDDPKRLFEYGREVAQLAQQPQTIVRHQRKELLHKVLIDTPDIDSVIRRHREVTAALVHAADLVLFVTTAERYKDMVAAQWVAEQSPQRAMAFILNKWDRASIGMQWDRRGVIDEDFQRVLKSNGFETSVMFKISCLENPDHPEANENDLPDLRAWLEGRLDSSVSTAIQHRRRVMAWGRLAAAISSVIPSRIESEPGIITAFETLASARQQAHSLTASTVAEIVTDMPDQSLWPPTPGLFGSYGKFLAWCASASTRARGWINPLSFAVTKALTPEKTGVGTTEPLWSSSGFSGAALQLVCEAVRKLHMNARSLPVRTVETEWHEAAAQLTSSLALAPSATWSDLLANAAQPSFRRFAGLGILLGLEAIIVVVLGVALWRIGYGFVAGKYVSSLLLYNTAAFIIVLILSGHVLANLFFPSLKRRFAAKLARRQDDAIDQIFDRMQSALREQVAAIDHLARRGEEMQRAIDQIVQSFRRGADSAAVDIFFSQQNPNAREQLATADVVEAPLRRAKFE
jgi:energy-coupling factor transporter ATP-binding protein EcfA2